MDETYTVDDVKVNVPRSRRAILRLLQGTITGLVCMLLMHGARWVLNWLDTQGLAVSLWAASALVAVWTFILWEEEL